jgi:Leucine-rich repeat (LRR) protein
MPLLPGTIPPEIGNLTGLTELWIYNTSMYGHFPDSLSDLRALEILVLANSYFSGEIPESLSSLSALEILDFSYNSMTGSLPLMLCNLESMTSFSVFLNLFSGTTSCIPVNVTDYLTYYNFLTGNMAEILASVAGMVQFDIGDNYYTGKMDMPDLSKDSLQVFAVYGNFFEGSLASNFGTFSELYELDIGQNMLSGTLAEFESLRKLVSFTVNGNSLQGPIPFNSLENCVALNLLYLDSNKFSGQMPETFGQSLIVLSYFTANDNHLSGSVSSRLLRLPRLIYIELTNNLLSGPSPMEVGVGSVVTYLQGQLNYFTGTIQSNWSGFHHLTHILLDNNFIQGTMPMSIGVNYTDNVGQEIGARLSMNDLSMPVNMLEGSIPSTLGTHTALTVLSLASNSLSNVLPKEITNLVSLLSLNLSSNDLSGPLAIEFSNMTTVVALSDNALSGQIPSNLFLSPSIAVIDLSTNCFSGSLPSSLCYPQSLTALLLNGLTSGTQCRAKFPRLLSTVLKGIVSEKSLSASFPNCLFDLRSLQTLQLAGNEIFGTLPTSALPENLTNIELGSNLLEGDIPLNVQHSGKFTTLGLERNRFSGTLSSDFVILRSGSNTTSTNLRLHINRLSGPIPSNFYNMSTINVLYGNLFSCRFNKELPPGDPNAHNYDCGSNNFNLSLFIWIGAMGLICLVILMGLAVVFFANTRIDERAPNRSIERKCLGRIQNVITRVYFNSIQWYYFKYPSAREIFVSTFQFLTIMKRSASGIGMLSLLYVAVAMLTYVGMKLSDASTVYYQYAWIVTTAYMHGAVPVVLIMIYYSFSVIMIAERIRSRSRKEKRIRSTRNVNSASSSQSVGSSRKISGRIGHLESEGRLLSAFAATSTPSLDYCLFVYQYILLPLFCQSLNAGVALYVNGMYVKLLEFEQLTPRQQFGIEVMLSAFKLGWTATFVPFAMTYFKHFSAGQRLFHHVLMLCMVVILAPILASAAGSGGCFYNLFVPKSPVDSTFEATVASTECIAQVFDHMVQDHQVIHDFAGCVTRTSSVTIASTANPPFVYSYQCGSSILNNYIPVFMYSYIFSCLFLPLSRVLLLQCPQATLKWLLPHKVYNACISTSLYDCEDMIEISGAASKTKALSISTKMIELNLDLKVHTRDQSSQRNVGFTIPEQAVQTDEENVIVLAKPTFPTSPSQSTDDEMPVPTGSTTPVNTALFDGPNVAAKRLLDFAMMVTFGLACPLLGLAVACSVFANAGVWRIMIGKYISYHATKRDADYNVAVLRLELSTKGVFSGSKNATWVVIFVGCIFWSLMLFDMVADVYGLHSGRTVVCIMLFVLPAVIFAVLRGIDSIGDKFRSYFSRFIQWPMGVRRYFARKSNRGLMRDISPSPS